MQSFVELIGTSVPMVLLVLAGAALLGALASMFQSLRAAFGGVGTAELQTARDLPERAALVEEKKALLRAIKDLEFEHAVGKIGEADFQRLDAAYRARAKQVLAELDRDVKPFQEAAERLIEERIAARRAGLPGSKKHDGEEASHASSAPAREAPARAVKAAALPEVDVAALPEDLRAKVEAVRAEVAAHQKKAELKQDARRSLTEEHAKGGGPPSEQGSG